MEFGGLGASSSQSNNPFGFPSGFGGGLGPDLAGSLGDGFEFGGSHNLGCLLDPYLLDGDNDKPPFGGLGLGAGSNANFGGISTGSTLGGLLQNRQSTDGEIGGVTKYDQQERWASPGVSSQHEGNNGDRSWWG